MLSCTGFQTDGARNAIAGVVRITGDTRSFDAQVQALLERRIRQVIEGIAAAHDATCTVTYTHEFAPTFNDPGCTRLAVQAAVGTLGVHRVYGDGDPTTGSEDFGVFAGHVPACSPSSGTATWRTTETPLLHSRACDFNDDVLTAGVTYLVAVVRSELPAN